VEGTFPDSLVIIGFPDRAAAESWYDSPAYREILHLRTENSRGDLFLVDGVDADHRATDILPLLRQAQEVEGSASRAAAT
jgi:hypothetical protein